MRSFFALLILALVAVSTVQAAAITGAAVTLSSDVAGGTAVTMSITMTLPSVLKATNGKISIDVVQFQVIGTCAMTAPVAKAVTSATSGAIGALLLTITNDATEVPAGVVTFTCTGVTNPAAAKVAVTAGAAKNLDGGTTTDDSSTATVVAIVDLSEPKITLSEDLSTTATTVTASFRTSTALSATATVAFLLTGFTFTGTAPVAIPCAFTSPAQTSTGALTGTSGAAVTLTITNTGAIIPALSQVTITCTGAGLTTPAKKDAVTGLTITIANPTLTTAVGTVAAIVDISAPTVTLTSAIANTATTVTISMKPLTAIADAAAIKVTLTGFVAGTLACAFTTPAKAAGTVSYAANVLSILNAGAVLAVKTAFTVTCTGFTLPAAQAAKTDVAFTNPTDTSATGTLPAILAAQFTGTRAVTLTSDVESVATTVTINFTTVAAIPASGKVTVALTGYTGTPVCKFTLPASVADPASALAANVLTVTATAAVIAVGATTITCTGLSNPAKKAALANVAIRVTNSADGVLQETTAATLPVILGAINAASVTLSNVNSAATGVTATITFTTTIAITASGRVLIKLTNFVIPTTAACAFTAPLAQAVTSSVFDAATGDLTITNIATAVALGVTTITCTGLTNPATQAASSTIDIRVQSSAGVTTERTLAASLVAIVPKITAAAITFAAGAKASASTTLTITMTTTTTVPATGTLTFTLGSSFTFGDASSCVITGSAGATKAAAGALTSLVITAAAAVSAGSVVITCAGVTLPVSQVAVTSMTVLLKNAAAVADQEWTNTGTIAAITATATTLVLPTITLTNDIAAASANVITISFTTVTAIPLSGKITVPLAGFAMANDLCKFTAPSGFANPASSTFAAPTLTIVLATTGPIAANTLVTLTCTGVTNPAAQVALTNLQLQTQDAGSLALDSTVAGTLPAILPGITTAAITLSNPNAAATGVTLTATFTTVSIIPASGRILLRLPNYAFTSPVCTGPAVAPISSTYAGTDLIVVLSANAIAASTITLTCTGATNPAIQAVITAGDIRTQTAANVNLDHSLSTSFPAITGAITAASVALSSSVAGATATATISFTTVTATPLSGKVTVRLAGFTAAATPVCKFTTPAGVTDPASALAGDLLTVTLNVLAAGAVPAGAVVLTCTGFTNPAAARANSTLEIFTQSALNANLDSTAMATLLQITPASGQLAVGAITQSNKGAAATGVTITTTFLASQAVPSGGKIKITLTGFTGPATVCTFTQPSALGNSASFVTAGFLTVVLPGGAAAGSIYTFTCAGLINPAASDTSTTTIITQTAADGTLDSTTTATIQSVTAVLALTTPAITLSNGSAAQTGVTMTITLTTATNVTPSGQFIFATGGLVIPAAPTCAFTSPTATIGTAAFATNVLTITLAALTTTLLTNTVPAGTVTITCTGITTPAAQVASAVLAWTTRSSAGTDLDRTAVATLVAITSVGAISSGSVTLSDNTAAATGVLATITLTTATAIPASGSIRFPMLGFLFVSPTCTFLAPSGTAAAASVVFSTPDVIVTIGATLIAAGTVTLNCTGVTNPPAQAGRSALHFRTTTAAAVLVDEGRVGTLVTIKPANGALGASAVTLSNAGRGAMGVTATVSLVVAQGVPAAGAIRVTLTNFNNTNNNTLMVAFTAPLNVNATATWFSGVLTVTLNSGSSIANGTAVSFTCSGLMTPLAVQDMVTSLAIETQAAGVRMDSTVAGTLVAITAVGALTNGAVTLSNAQSGVAGVTLAVAFTSAAGNVAGGMVNVMLPGFRFPATPVCTFTKPSALVNTAAWTPAMLSITLTAAGAIGDYAFSCTGATNPGSPQPQNNMTIVSIANAAGSDTDRQTTASLVAILAPPVNFTAQPMLVVKTDTTFSITFATSNNTDQVRCLAQNASLANPTAASIIAGAVSTSSPNKTASTGAAQTVSFTGLTAATAYKVWCALEAASLLTTPALEVTTGASGAASFTAGPALSAKTAVMITITFTASTNKDMVRCQARVAGGAFPTAADILAGTGAVGASAKVNTTGAAQTVDITGLTANTTYTVWCALELTLTLPLPGLAIMTDAVVIPTGKLFFVAGSGSFSAAATDFTVSVGFMKSDSSVDTTPTAAITLTAVAAAGAAGVLTATSATVTPTLGMSKFTAKISAVGTYTLVASATGYTSAERAFKVQAAATGTPNLAWFQDPKVNTAVFARRAFASQPIVTIQDSTGSVFLTGTSATLSVTLAGTGLGPNGALSRAAVGGVATFAGLFIESTGSVTITASANGATSITTSVTISRAFGYYAFSAVPSFETTNANFAIQPAVTAYGTDGTVFTTQVATITLTAAATAGVLSVISLTPTLPSQVMTSGLATFSGVKAVATTGLYSLTASSGTSSVATQFNVYADATAASTASSTARSKSFEFKLKLAIDASVVDNAATKAQFEAAIRADLCLAAALPLSNCNIQVTIVKASVTATVVVLNDGNTSRPSPQTIANLLIAQVADSTSPLRNSPTTGQLESFIVATPTESTVKAGSASTVAVASATAVAAGVVAALLL